jgi:hypothetical protein
MMEVASTPETSANFYGTTTGKAAMNIFYISSFAAFAKAQSY